MRKLLAPVLLCFLLSVSSFAQSGAVSAGYTYLRTPGGGGHANMNGWYFIPSVNLNNWFGVLADFTNFYGSESGQNLTIHGFTFGPIASWKNSTRITPVAFTEAGLIRSNLDGNVTNAFGWVLGGGFEVKLNSHVNLQVIPGEYVLTRADSTNHNNYTMKVGLTFPFD